MEAPNKYHKPSHEVAPINLTPINILPRDLCFSLHSLLNLQDSIALSSTCRKWRAIGKSVFTERIQHFFGRTFLGERNPLAVTVRLWVPSFKTVKSSCNQRSKLVDVLKALPTGTVDEIATTMDSLTIQSNLSENPLILAIKCRRLDVVKRLVESGFPLGTVIDEREDTYDYPIYKAMIEKNPSIVHYLLQNGALLNISIRKRRDYYVNLFYECLKSDPGLDCAALLIRSWLNEVGLNTLQNDEHLPSIAGDLIAKGQWEIGALLMSYGVIPKFSDILMVVYWLVQSGKKDALEFMRVKGFINYQTYAYEENSLSDLAGRYGQFELEDFLINVHKVPYKKENSYRRLYLQEIIINSLQHAFVDTSGVMQPWTRSLKCIDHYRLNTDVKFSRAVIDELFYELNDAEDKKPILQAIQDLIDREVILKPSQRQVYNQLLKESDAP